MHGDEALSRGGGRRAGHSSMFPGYLSISENINSSRAVRSVPEQGRLLSLVFHALSSLQQVVPCSTRICETLTYFLSCTYGSGAVIVVVSFRSHGPTVVDMIAHQFCLLGLPSSTVARRNTVWLPFAALVDNGERGSGV